MLAVNKCIPHTAIGALFTLRTFLKPGTSSAQHGFAATGLLQRTSHSSCNLKSDPREYHPGKIKI